MKKLVIAALLAAVIAAAVISLLYNRSLKSSAASLGIEEKILADKIGPPELYDFYAQPRESADNAIIWEGPGSSGQKLLKVNFNGDSIRHYRGLGFPLTLVLSAFCREGAIEMWVKADSRINAPPELAVFLKDARGYQQEIELSVPLKFDNKWQRVVLPLKEFKPAAFNKGNTDRFSWEIDRIAFSLAPFTSNKPAVLWIRNLRIVNDGKTISTLF